MWYSPTKSTNFPFLRCFLLTIRTLAQGEGAGAWAELPSPCCTWAPRAGHALPSRLGGGEKTATWCCADLAILGCCALLFATCVFAVDDTAPLLVQDLAALHATLMAETERWIEVAILLMLGYWVYQRAGLG
mmetsp:Transcript_4505/g.7269  ORF Transcript_4505/g.7269 Transcript_4505/m.7269 type:complete len:132 (-) Transcript_4505:289-684(-)